MTQMYPIEPYEQDGNAVADYRRQSTLFLARAREYLAVDDLHQAAEKGCGAAAWMAKAVAKAQGWHYEKHDEFFAVMCRTETLSDDPRLPGLWHVANTLHGFFYTRKTFLRPESISQGLDQIENVLDILEPLTKATFDA